MLRGKLTLHDILDTEAFVERLIQRSGLELSFHDHEDLSTFLIEQAWELSLRYQPGIIRKGFSTWAGLTLSRRITDWQRQGKRTKWQFADRIYERALPSFVPLDDRPDAADPASEMDLSADRLADLLGLERTRGRDRARSDNGDGEAADRVAA